MLVKTQDKRNLFCFKPIQVLFVSDTVRDFKFIFCQGIIAHGLLETTLTALLEKQCDVEQHFFKVVGNNLMVLKT